MTTTKANQYSLDVSDIDNRARWQQRPPKEFPSPWASEWGFDDYGLWQTLLIPTGNGKNVPYKMRFIPRGEFMMGSPENEKDRVEDEVQHKVTLTQGFWLGETTVTQALWQAVMDSNPSKFRDKNDANTFPVELISWHDCNEFCRALNEKIGGLSLTLPTEAQWEYACRAGTQTAFSVGDKLTPNDANFDSNNKQTVAALSYSPNTWGLYQMHGNVWEWCQDAFQHYGTADAIDPVNQSVDGDEITLRVLRGGSWSNFARLCRSAFRNRARAVSAFGAVGLRVAQIEPASTHAGEAARGTIDPPRSKGDVTSDDERREGQHERNSDSSEPPAQQTKVEKTRSVIEKLMTELANKNSNFTALIEERLNDVFADHVAEFSDDDIEITMDFYGEVDGSFLECQFKSFEFVYNSKGKIKYTESQESLTQVVVSIAVDINFSATASFSFSVKDSIDRDYVSLGSNSSTVERAYRGRVSLAIDVDDIFDVLAEIEIDEGELYQLFSAMHPAIVDFPTSIDFGAADPFSEDDGDWGESNDLYGDEIDEDE